MQCDSRIKHIMHYMFTKDVCSYKHSIRVAEYTELLLSALMQSGKLAGWLTEGICEVIGRAALLHDVGKMAIPDYILLKQGKLTSSEFSIMQTHTVCSDAILKQYIWDSISYGEREIFEQVALYHHERIDGSGYPCGLAGDGIPVCAKIVMIADVFDALYSDRPYRSKMQIEESLEIILSGAGTKFDADMAKLFCDEIHYLTKSSLIV